MNRRDKAKEIYNGFYESFPFPLSKEIAREAAKQLSLRHVRGIINELEKFIDVSNYTDEDVNFNEVDRNLAEERISYYIGVEREINKL